MQDTATEAPTLDVKVSSEKHNLKSARLCEEAIRNGEAHLASSGPLVVSTGQYTGRSPKDKFVVEEESSLDKIWWGSVNKPMSEEKFNALRDRMLQYIDDKELYVQDLYVGADP